MFTTTEWIALLAIATLGHVMALFWRFAAKREWSLCGRKIYELSIGEEQIRRELKNSLHAPIHAVILAGFVLLGFFANRDLSSVIATALATTLWAEVWHYVSHRALHLPALHWIHVEHHRSRLNSPFTAISFSFPEKIIFDLGLLGPLAVIDCFVSLNLYGVAAWLIGYLVINSFSHANFEIKSRDYNKWFGKMLTSATYHALHHSRYTGNYGLGTRIMDRAFDTEWADYEAVYDRVNRERRPLRELRERAAPVEAPQIVQ
jgi:lathosterol oxidase